MEQWQRLVIKENLPELVDLTSCNTKLLTRLFSKDILTDEEINEIDVAQNPKRKAYNLYGLIVTRKNAYPSFLSACKETKQTGVVCILEDGERVHKLLQAKQCNVFQYSTKTSESSSNANQKSHATTNSIYTQQLTPSMNVSKWDLNVLEKNHHDSEGRTSLHRALADGQSLNVIRNLIDNKADYKLKDTKKEGVLHFAVRGGDIEVISLLMSFKLDVNEVDELGETPFHKVRFTNNRDYVGLTKHLLENGAHINAKNKKGYTVAHLLSINENISSHEFRTWVKCVIYMGHGDVFTIRDPWGRTPLHDAIGEQDLDLNTIKLILESSKLDIDQQDDNGNSLLLWALSFGRSLERIKDLISLGANIKLKNQFGRGALHMAVIGGNKEVIQYLISQGLDVNDRDNRKETPLHFVRMTKSRRYVELTNELLQNGADLYSKADGGRTLAHFFSTCNPTDVYCEDFKSWIKAMIINGHSHLFTTRAEWGRTPLHSSMQEMDLELETIKLIIEFAKLDINQPDDEGSTILHLALGFGRNLDTIRSLVRLGADWKKKGKNDQNVLHCAVLGSNKEAFLYFKSLGEDVNAKDKFGETPLHKVRATKSKDYLGMTKFLLENGANLYARKKNGRTLDQLMSSREAISAAKFHVWKKGIIHLGHAMLFQHESNENKSFLSRLFGFEESK